MCVIGAGSSGIASCQVLHARGIEFDCFEVGSEVGGNWRYMNDNGMSSAYRVAAHQHLAADDGLRDLPDAGGLPRLPEPLADRRVLRRLRRPLRLSRPDPLSHRGDRGSSRRPAAAGGCAGASCDSGEEGSATYAAVFVANGHHWDARWPEPPFPGQDGFEGEQMHVHDYKTPDVLEGKRVLVLGIGNSATRHRGRGVADRRADAAGDAPRRLDPAQVPATASPPTSSATRSPAACRSP